MKVALILAGGKSSRMKEDKANLIINKMPLLDYQVEKLKAFLSSNLIFISGKQKDKNSVPDIISNLGPVEGLRSFLYYLISKKINASEILVIPVDMPLLKSHGLKEFFYFSDYEDALIFDHFNLPLKLRNTKELLQILNSMVKTKSNYSFKNLLKKINVKSLAISNLENFINTNTKEEWNEAISKTN